MEQTLREQRDAMVRKDNALIQRSRFSLTAEQQKLMCYLITKLKPTDTKFQDYTFSMSEFMQVCGLEDGGNKYKQLKDSLLRIASKTAWMQLENGDLATVHLLEKVILHKNGTVTVRFDDDLKPFLLELSRCYTEYPLIWVLTLQSKYAIRLLEYLYSIHYRVYDPQHKPLEWEMSLEQIRERLGAESYKNWGHLQERVLKPAIDEINDKTGKTVEYFPVKANVGKSVVGVRFVIRDKEPLDRFYLNLKASEDMDARLNGEKKTEKEGEGK